MKEHLPPFVSSTNPYHRRRPLQRQVPKHKTETYRQSFFPLTTTLWNNLPENVQQTKSIRQVKHFLARNDTNPLPFFYNGSRKTQITHCKLRLGMSDLNYDLLNRHLTTNSSCDFGERTETSEHYILHCPHFTHVCQNTIFKLPANLLNITTVLQGDPNISSNMNSLLFKAVQDVIAQSVRFAIKWQTQLNSYWHKSILSLSLSLLISDRFLLLFTYCLI